MRGGWKEEVVVVDLTTRGLEGMATSDSKLGVCNCNVSQECLKAVVRRSGVGGQMRGEAASLSDEAAEGRKRQQVDAMGDGGRCGWLVMMAGLAAADG